MDKERNFMQNPAARVATDARLLGRSCESLLGICAGIVADGVLNDEEIKFLNLWLTENAGLAYTWPGEVVYARVREILSDGQISEDERAYLKETLNELVGRPVQETGASFGCACTLAIDKVDDLKIVERAFCFTGNFIFGTRSACEKAVLCRGGTVSDNITAGLDYLVIGTMVSEAWTHTTFGRKIEKAIEYRNRGYKLKIVGENQWVKAVKACESSATETCPLWRVIAALGIPRVGSRSAQILADRFGSLESLMAASLEELERTEKVGPVMAESVYEYFHGRHRGIGVDIIAPREEDL